MRGVANVRVDVDVIDIHQGGGDGDGIQQRTTARRSEPTAKGVGLDAARGGYRARGGWNNVHEAR